MGFLLRPEHLHAGIPLADPAKLDEHGALPDRPVGRLIFD